MSERGFIRSDGEQIYFESWGAKGETVVLGHGMGGSHAVWCQQVPFLVQRYRVVTWDQRGFGRSTNNAGVTGPLPAAKDLLRLLDHLEIERAHIIGQSMGGCPPEFQLSADVVLPFEFANIRGQRAIVSGHGPQVPDGSLAPPFGQVGSEVSMEEAVLSARLTALSMLGSLQRSLGSLDRVTGWLRVLGMVNSTAGFHQQPTVINGFSDLILEVFGAEVGRHARSAIGVASLPFDIPVEVEAEVSIQ